MDGAIVVILLIVALVSSLSKNKKQQNGKAEQRARQQAAQQRTVQQRAAQQRAAQHQAANAQMLREEPAERHVMQPTISVTPHTDDMFEGSMYMESLEGEDPCHDHELQPEVKPCEVSPLAESAQPAPAAGGLRLNWTGDDMVRAFVMSEILTRPQNRRQS